jgi:hypothetical protein
MGSWSGVLLSRTESWEVRLQHRGGRLRFQRTWAIRLQSEATVSLWSFLADALTRYSTFTKRLENQALCFFILAGCAALGVQPVFTG